MIEKYTMQTVNIKKKENPGTGMTILIKEKVVFTTKNFKRNKEENYIMIQEWIHQEHMTILNSSLPDKRYSEFTKQTVRTKWRNR